MVFPLCGPVSAEDWPTFGADNRRSSVTGEVLELPLKESWVFKATHPPQPAWPAPAKQDFFHHHYNLRPTVTYDRAFHIVGADDLVIFGSSANDKIYALDAKTGQVRWTFFTEGPVRLAPVIADNKVYAGCDDGYVYCLSENDGSLVWKYRVAEQNRMVPGNGRMTSLWPVRAGLVVGLAVFIVASVTTLLWSSHILHYRQDSASSWILAIEVAAQISIGVTLGALFLGGRPRTLSPERPKLEVNRD